MPRKTKKTDDSANESHTNDKTVTPTLPALQGESVPVVAPSNLTPENMEGLNKYQQATAGEFAELLKFKKGKWKTADGTELAIDTLMAVDITSISDGFVKWENKKPVASDMKRCIAGPPPLRETLGDTDPNAWPIESGAPRDVWQRTMSVVLKDIESWMEYLFNASSVGGLNCIRKALRNCTNGLAKGETGIPIVALETDSYMHPEFDEVFVPILLWKGWKSEAELMGGPPEDPDPLLNDKIPF